MRSSGVSACRNIRRSGKATSFCRTLHRARAASATWARQGSTGEGIMTQAGHPTRTLRVGVEVVVRDGRVSLALLSAFVFLAWLPSAATARDLRGHVEVRTVLYPNLDLVEGRMRILARYERGFGKWQIVAS